MMSFQPPSNPPPPPFLASLTVSMCSSSTSLYDKNKLSRPQDPSGKMVPKTPPSPASLLGVHQHTHQQSSSHSYILTSPSPSGSRTESASIQKNWGLKQQLQVEVSPVISNWECSTFDWLPFHPHWWQRANITHLKSQILAPHIKGVCLPAGSWICALLQLWGGCWLHVSDPLQTLLSWAPQVSKSSGGAFNTACCFR